MRSFVKILCLLLLVAAGYTICAAEDPTASAIDTDAEKEEESSKSHKASHRASREAVTFINFSDRPIQLYWVDTSTPERTKYPTEIAPYEPSLTKTSSGDLFVYSLDGAEFRYEVEQTNSNYDHDDDDDDESELISSHQIHILGLDMAPPQKEHVKNEIVRRKTETKSVVCGTTEGDIRIKIKPSWSPLGAARFLELAKSDTRYFDGCALNRVVPRFLTQFGIGANYEQRTAYRDHIIKDDMPADPEIPFQPGYMSYAGSGEDSRTTEVFVVMPDTPRSQLDYFGDNSWETPFGYVEPEDLGVVAKWHDSYGDMAPWGDGPDPQFIYKEDGYEYLEEEFPDMSYIKGCVILADADLNEEGEPMLRQSYDQWLLQYDNSSEVEL